MSASNQHKQKQHQKRLAKKKDAKKTINRIISTTGHLPVDKGRVKQTKELQDAIAAKLGVLPDQVDLSDKAPAVKDQEELGASTAIAVISAIETDKKGA